MLRNRTICEMEFHKMDILRLLANLYYPTRDLQGDRQHTVTVDILYTGRV